MSMLKSVLYESVWHMLKLQSNGWRRLPIANYFNSLELFKHQSIKMTKIALLSLSYTQNNSLSMN